MKEYEVFNCEDSLDGHDSCQIDYISANNLDEAIVKAYERNGPCVLRWLRKNGRIGEGDYEITKEQYLFSLQKIKNK